MLEVASVAGKAFDTPAVAAGLGGASDAVESTCHRLCDEPRWLRRVGTWEWPDGALAERYAFQHSLYQRALYDRLAPSRRATLHERIGRRLEADSPAGPPRPPSSWRATFRAAATGGARWCISSSPRCARTTGGHIRT